MLLPQSVYETSLGAARNLIADHFFVLFSEFEFFLNSLFSRICKFRKNSNSAKTPKKSIEQPDFNSPLKQSKRLVGRFLVGLAANLLHLQ